MAGKVNNKMSVAVACLVALIQISSSLAATTWKVGDTSGWINSGVNYTTWASGKTFAVGDTLDFIFTSGAHTVSEVSKADYDACSSSSPISTTSNSPANIKLSTTGAHYYICQFGNHCTTGQKLAITVSASSSSTPSSPSPTSSTTPTSGSPSPTSSTTPTTPTTTTSSPPPPPSSSGVVAGAGLVMPFLIGAAAFLM